MAALDVMIKEPSTPADACVIWLHGLGADGNDFVSIVPQLLVPGSAIRFVFPHAPIRPITINNNMPCRAWFDIYSLTDLQREDEVGIAQSKQSLVELIAEQENKGIDPSRIVLAGFSQGGAIAMMTALTYPRRLAGVIGLSTYLPMIAARETSAVNQPFPVFLAHGSQDPVLPLQLGHLSHMALQQQGLSVTWKEYAMAHEVCLDEVRDLQQWMTSVLAVSSY